MDYATIYMIGFIATVGAFAIRAKDVDSRTLFFIALTWPLSILFALFVFVLDLIGYDMDVQESTKMFGFRRPTNPKAKGFAITVFGTEIQFYSMKKA